MREWQRLDADLHKLLDPVLQEPVPERLQRRPWSRSWWAASMRAAAAVGWLALGALIGWLAHGPSWVEPTRVAALAPYAASAHMVYTSELRHPVEIGADDQQHLVAWLSKRLDTELRVPELGALGYQLVGGRLLPADGRPAAFFLYEDARGRRLSLVVRSEVWDNRDTAFRHAREGGVQVFYWVDGPFGYGLAGALDKTELSQLAQEVYRQLAP